MTLFSSVLDVRKVECKFLLAVHNAFSVTAARYCVLVSNAVKALPKKRKHQTTRNLLLNLSKTSVVKRQALWYSSCIAAYIWFLYWIAYDFFVWQKPITEINPVNYVGAIASIALIWAGIKILKPHQAETANPPKLLPQKPALQPKPQLETQQKPQKTAPANSGCNHYLGYLNQRQKQQEIPSECLMCKHVIKCMNSTN